jgi:4-alpha-glucanotransferase
MSGGGPFPDPTYGVLLHPSSFPGRDGIGTLGAEAFAFVEWLATTGAGIWQILPLTLNGQDDSPYFSSSAFAGNPWLVDLTLLHEQGLVDDPHLPDRVTDARIDYDTVRATKRPILWAAAERFLATPDHPWRAGFEAFVRDAGWLTETCHFFARQEAEGGAPWWAWPEPLRRREPDAVAASRRALADEIARWEAVLYFFEVQWRELRADANRRGIVILGDLPIYVAPDSADVWLHQDQFQLDDDGRLTVQAGVPPDYFSETGQLWRNPLYRWDVMADDGYAWWLSRLGRALELSDVVRIDHFRALSAYWEVAADAADAMGGRWVPGPGQDFLDAVRAAFPAMPFVAEDLGLLDDAVLELRDANGLPGMRILQFGFDGTPDNPHQPHRFPAACIVYTGTHDNNTVAGWWHELTPEERDEIAHYFQFPADADIGRVVWSFVEAAIGSRAVAAVVPMQDLLVLGESARMNVPSSTRGNWSWRMPAGALSADLAHSMRRLCERYARC